MSLGVILEPMGQKQLALMIAASMEKMDKLSEDLVETMASLLVLGTLDAERSDPDGKLVRVPDHPGYLCRDIQGVRVFVPFNLAKVSPTSDILGEVIKIGNQVKLGARSHICVSGSTAFLGVLRVVADLDFCEYYLLENGDPALALAAVSEIEDIPLVCAKFDGQDVRPPWSCLTDISKFLKGPLGRLKLDFMSCGILGPMPTTNMILATTDGEDGSASESFAYQEAIIGADVPLHSLVGPERFGAYLLFLRDQARKYLDESSETPQYAIKALKRLLALKSALGDGQDVDIIVEKLNRPEIEEVVLRIRVDELLEIRPHLPHDVPQRFTGQIDALVAESSLLTAEDIEQVMNAARELAEALLDETETDIAEYA